MSEKNMHSGKYTLGPPTRGSRSTCVDTDIDTKW